MMQVKPGTLLMSFHNGWAIMVDIPKENSFRDEYISVEVYLMVNNAEGGHSNWMDITSEGLALVIAYLGQCRNPEMVKIYDIAGKYTHNKGRIKLAKDRITMLAAKDIRITYKKGYLDHPKQSFIDKYSDTIKKLPDEDEDLPF